MKHSIEKKIKCLLLIFLISATVSCNENEIFEREQYKNVFALVNSTDEHNVFNAVHSLDEPESVGYIVASMGGTNPTEKDIDIVLKHDAVEFDSYNKSQFDMDADKFANLLPVSKYSIDNYTFKIRAGERNGTLPVRVRPEGLSPDSVYFISLKVDKYTGYELNPDRSTVLYRVMIENQYAAQSTITNYSLRGTRNGVNIMGVKQMLPVAGNRVRIMAGMESFSDSDRLAKTKRFGIVLEITPDNKINFIPFKNIEVTKVDGDPDFPNIFMIENDGYKTYKTFLLRYDYRDGNTVYQMKEELRLEFKEKK